MFYIRIRNIWLRKYSIIVSLPKKIEGNDTDIIKMFFMTYRGYYEYYIKYKLEYIIKKQTALEKL